ncbi:hypothetical protein TWF225_003493 [Orbilia oligospora]|uniref:Chromatin structure-remodeling complex protein rsc1 n=1 Tax=Orbilia oligospora TaxID=2813651 RepID=A0A8H2HSW8_ORBOL|nr:hypothetical protein TWF225_003493 [Orbilia oligospora]KAF3239459.1 hypothetical protein TWF128_011789 [Orbilia oligospora]KAF3263317.1 hypothetical protein TWF217_003734 [Orbilia oligospora]KAF3274666.1 hypothetical protein TWF132_003272 [Orbilia oligospora]TGJ71026.1 hypothetical protein EYR41_003028 [Orbilia oligospora]
MPATTTTPRTSERAPDAELALMKSVLDTIISYKDENENPIAEVFMDVVNRRAFPDYFQIIKNPIALRNVLNKLKQKRYPNFKTFINDCSRVFHNAKTYNRPSSQIYKDAVTLEGVLLEELKKLTKLENPVITEEEAVLPDLGPLPTTDSEGEDEEGEGDAGAEEEDGSNDGSGDEEEEEDEDEEDEDDEEAEDEDEEMEDADAIKNDPDNGSEDGASRTRRSSRRSAKKITDTGDDDDDDDDEKKPRGRKEPKRRGRPPRVDAPFECRIKSILKGIRKYKTDDDGPRHAAFEKIPDPKISPEYHRAIENPIAIDTLKKKVKRRIYRTVEEFMDDVYLMFDNAIRYNEDNSQVHRDAIFLKAEAKKIFDLEMEKDDSSYIDPSSKSSSDRDPVAFIEHNGDTFSIGDWIELVNPLDDKKPIVAQIFRTFKKRSDGKLGINVCWYYRPENTVHRVNKRFYENEVAKTGQYRDHDVQDIIGRCFVMFYTKASRGRPIGSQGKNIYICEARYNEEKRLFNRIKTWKSCIPDEIRSRKDDTELWQKQVPLKKFTSPIKHLLPSDAKMGDKPPTATWVRDDAPPQGAVFLGERRSVDSPSPEPTPPPKPKSPTPPPPPPPQAAPATQPRPQSTRRTTVAQPIMTPAPVTAQRQIYQTPAQLAPMPGPYAQFTPQQAPAAFYATPQPQYPQTPSYPQMQIMGVPGPSQGHGQIRPQADVGSDMPGDNNAFTINTAWTPKALSHLETRNGVPVFFSGTPQNVSNTKITFQGWGSPFNQGPGVPLRSPSEARCQAATRRILQADTNGIPFDEDQKWAWDDATKTLNEFTEREHAAGAKALDNRPLHVAMKAPLETAFAKLLNTKEIETDLYSNEEVRHYRSLKRKRGKEPSSSDH